MMSVFSLKAASEQDGQDILDMLNEIGEGEQGFTNSAHNLNQAQFKAYLRHCERYHKGLGLLTNHVPQTTYWFLKDGYPVGVIKLRHELNDNLRQQGGHIGYSIRQTERSKGYGHKMLAAVLEEARAIGLDNVLLTVFKSNMASRKVVEGNGGKLQRIYAHVCYYWISLS